MPPSIPPTCNPFLTATHETRYEFTLFDDFLLAGQGFLPIPKQEPLHEQAKAAMRETAEFWASAPSCIISSRFERMTQCMMQAEPTSVSDASSSSQAQKRPRD